MGQDRWIDLVRTPPFPVVPSVSGGDLRDEWKVVEIQR